jgi:hypothetical protein
MVRKRVCGTSEKYVLQPSRDDILADLLLGIIRRFANDICWKEYWMIKKATDKAEVDKNILPNSPSNQLFQQFGFDAENKNPNIIEDDSPNKNVAPTIIITPDHKGFGTTLKPIENKSRAPKGTDKLESFITDMETALIDLALDDKNTYRPNARSQEIRDLANPVAESNNLIIPAYKTNSFTTTWK